MHNPSKMDKDLRGVGCRRVPVGVGARRPVWGRSAPFSSYHRNVEYGPVHEHPGDRRAELYYFDPLAGGVGGLTQGQIGSAERAGIYGRVAGRWPGMGRKRASSANRPRGGEDCGGQCLQSCSKKHCKNPDPNSKGYCGTQAMKDYIHCSANCITSRCPPSQSPWGGVLTAPSGGMRPRGQGECEEYCIGDCINKCERLHGKTEKAVLCASQCIKDVDQGEGAPAGRPITAAPKSSKALARMSSRKFSTAMVR